MEYYLQVLKKYAEFGGRARRSEYWYFALFSTIISIGFSIIDAGFASLTGMDGIEIFEPLYSLAVLVPSLAVGVRRLHDTGRSGWNLFWVFLPIVGWVILLLYLIEEGHVGENQYGLNPKVATYDDDDYTNHLVD